MFPATLEADDTETLRSTDMLATASANTELLNYAQSLQENRTQSICSNDFQSFPRTMDHSQAFRSEDDPKNVFNRLYLNA